MSRTETLAAFFRAHPNRWVDGRELAGIAGAYAWRSRVSDARRQLGMTITNRQRHVRRSDGSAFTISEYCYVEDRRTGAGATVGASTPAVAV